VTGPGPDDGVEEPFDVDPRSAYPARIYNYLLGGDDNFAADREAANHLYGGLPGGIETARMIARFSHRFMNDAVRYLAAELGARQFLNLSSVVRIPGLDDVHDVVQQISPEARVVYVVSDTVVLAHAHEIQASSPAGGTSFVHDDLTDLPALMRQVATMLDLSLPVVVIAQGVLHYVSGERDPHEVVSQIVDPLAPGSYVVVTHAASDLGDAQIAAAAKRQAELTKAMRWPIVPRSQDEILEILGGLELIDPGLVPLNRWDPSAPPPNPPNPSSSKVFPWYAGVARKPS
jgi:hypothetical protein